MLARMTWLNAMEKRFGGLAFPAFLRYYALLHALVFVTQLVQPQIGEILEFDRAKILSGEVWRVVTFLFAASGFGGLGPVSVVFFAFMVMVMFMISDALENAWGVFRTSLFYYLGIACLIFANFLWDRAIPASGMQLYGAAFLAFATLFPRVEFLMFFVLPVQVRWLAWFQVAAMVYMAFMNPLMWLYFPIAYLNYILFAGIPAWRDRAKPHRGSPRAVKRSGNGEAFHRCVVCDRNDIADPEAEFRVGPDGNEYCEQHLPAGNP